jgi:hypothetical protein
LEQGKQLALEVLTWILSPLSIIGLAICIFVFSTSIKSGRSPRNEITNHLCVWLLVGNVLLLLFMDRNYFHLGGVRISSRKMLTVLRSIVVVTNRATVITF